MSKEGINWLKLVKRARKDDKGFEELAKVLEPQLTGLAGKIASQLCEDAKQAALIKIWRTLSKIDLEREDTIRAILFEAAVSGMRTEVRKHLKFIKSNIIIGEIFFENFSSNNEESKYHFKGLLKHYCDYIRRTGSMRGAHVFFANMHHVTIDIMKRKFYNEASKFLETEGLSGARIDRESIVRELLEG